MTLDLGRSVNREGEPTDRGRWWEVAVLAVAFLLVNLAGARWQKQLSFENRQGWEGATYLAVAKQFAAGQVPVADEAPMVFRVGTPFLAALVHRAAGLDFFASFKVVNGTANVLILGLLVAWLRRFLADWKVRTALVLAFLLQWDTPVRWMYFFPPHTDPWMWVFLLAGMLAVEGCRERPTAGRIARVTALTVVGVCFREVVLIVALALPFAGNPIRGGELRGRWREVLPRLVALPAGLLTMAALRHVARDTGGFAFAWTAAHWLYTKPWPTYLQSWFLAFGPMLWLAILLERRTGAFLAARQHLAVYLVAFALLGDIGGSDTERLLFWTMPVVYVLIGRALEGATLPVWLLVVLAGAQLIASRAVFWPIPDFPSDAVHVWPIFTPFGRDVPFMDLFSISEERPKSLASLSEFLAFGAALGGWFVWRGRGSPAAGPGAGPVEHPRNHREPG